VNIGLSSVIGMVQPVEKTFPGGASVLVTDNGRRVMVPLAPGALTPIHIGPIVVLAPGISVPVVDERPVVLALDGEREVVLRDADQAEVTLELTGPWMVDVERTLRLAVKNGVFEIEAI
jgi:hypothetical protein